MGGLQVQGNKRENLYSWLNKTIQNRAIKERAIKKEAKILLGYLF